MDRSGEQNLGAAIAKQRISDSPTIPHALNQCREECLLDNDPFSWQAQSVLTPIEPGDRIKFLIVGVGMGGIMIVIKLMQAGFSLNQIRLVDAASGESLPVFYVSYHNVAPGHHNAVSRKLRSYHS